MIVVRTPGRTGCAFTAAATLAAEALIPVADAAEGDTGNYLPAHWSFGIVGYWYEQLTGDSDNPPIFGDFKGHSPGAVPLTAKTDSCTNNPSNRSRHLCPE